MGLSKSSINRLKNLLFGGQLQKVLIASFSLVAALTVGLNAWVVSRVIADYLAGAQDARVARDMDLAEAFYQLKLDEITAVGHRMVQDPRVIEYLPEVFRGQAYAFDIIDNEISRKITVPGLGGTHLIAVLDTSGEIWLARVLSAQGELSPAIVRPGNWANLPIVSDTLLSEEEKYGTEVIPGELLTQVGLGDQAFVTLKDTPMAAPEPFDIREGTAGLALTGVYPFRDGSGEISGAVLVVYLFNNDFTLVDRVKEVAGVDTVTVFFGDLRVSTNVPDEAGNRAVGTRVSQEVRQVVLEQGRDYKGKAFVVNETYITRYEPLCDHLGQVVGSLYVGARLSAFAKLIQDFNSRVALITLVCVVLAGVIAVPIARIIIQPITALVAATQRLAKGDMTVRVIPQGNGELAQLGQSFNTMAENLDKTQQELLHKERLASMGQLAAGVAHEINNPLGTILLFSDVMYKETSDGDPRRSDLKTIVDETIRCKNIVADLLNFARQQEVLARETDINALLEQVIDVISRQELFQDIKIVQHFSPGIPVIQADPDQLQQVFINLFNNAAEAIETNGEITLTTRLLSEQWLEIKFADNGCGIPEENLGRIFTPFFTTKALGLGTGLGLSIVYGIIKIHRGQISVQSQVGKGTTFTITLPIRLPEEQMVPKSDQEDLIG
jgi:two-component system NtrC family sensor kinase